MIRRGLRIVATMAILWTPIGASAVVGLYLDNRYGRQATMRFASAVVVLSALALAGLIGYAIGRRRGRREGHWPVHQPRIAKCANIDGSPA